MLQEFTTQSVPENVPILPSTVATKLGYNGFEISDCFILVNDPEVSESRNNGQLFPFLMHSYDYLEIVNDGRMVGRYCGRRSRQNIFLTGDQILIKFHSDSSAQRQGFLMGFTAVSLGKHKNKHVQLVSSLFFNLSNTREKICRQKLFNDYVSSQLYLIANKVCDLT